jgi:hypothetical protein
LFELFARLEVQSKVLSLRCEPSIAVGARLEQPLVATHAKFWASLAARMEPGLENSPLRRLVCYNALLVPLETSRG